MLGSDQSRGARVICAPIALNMSSSTSRAHAGRLRVARPPLITSADNASLRLARSVAHHGHDDLFWCEGPRFVQRSFDSPLAIQQLIVAPELWGPAEIAVMEWLKRANLSMTPVAARLFASISRAPSPTGLGVIVLQRRSGLPSNPTGLWLVARGITTPGNLGTIVRTCEAARVARIIASDGTVSPFEPSAVRASMGSIFGMPIVKATWPAVLGWSRHWGVQLVGTGPRGGIPLREARLCPPLAVVLGSEKQGLPAARLADCDLVVSIPMLGPMDSLNVAVAAGVVLYEVTAQA